MYTWGNYIPSNNIPGTKARFDTETGRHVLQCFNHHISDFIQGAKEHGLELVDLNEYFDSNDRSDTPRILTLLFRKI